MNSSQKRRFTCACAHNVRSHFHDETSVGLVQDGLVLQSTLKTMIGSFMMLTIMCVACNLHIDVEDTQKEATEITTQMRHSHTGFFLPLSIHPSVRTLIYQVAVLMVFKDCLSMIRLLYSQYF